MFTVITYKIYSFKMIIQLIKGFEAQSWVYITIVDEEEKNESNNKII